MKTQPIIKKFFQSAAVISLALIFIALGNWQLDRSVIVKELNAAAKVIDPKIYSLGELAEPSVTLDSRNVNKSVAVSGFYVANFKAPVQKDIDGQVSDWEVALLQVDGSDPESGILVVRGLWEERLTAPEIAMAKNVTVTGTLLPKQNEDRAENIDGQISRVDSSLLVTSYSGQLYDGFILATGEELSGQPIERSRISAPELTAGVPGYYWQHISYVVVWWFMAALVLWAPFYRRRD